MVRGVVYLVGAGPGAADLLSLRALRALQAADVIVWDNLLPGDFLCQLGLDGAGRTVRKLRSGETRTSHEKILRFMAEHARSGRTVARLKTGDPHVFGRSAEEVEFLKEAGVPWEVIPGMTAATAVPTTAGLPLTWRGEGRSFAAFTGRLAGGDETRSLPRADTLVAFMSVSVLGSLVERLMEEGHEPTTPAALVERGEMPWERRVLGELQQMPRLARQHGISSPALLVVGQAAEPRGGLRNGPIVLFTGLDPTRFRRLGRLLHWPALRVQPTGTSPHAVVAAIEELREPETDWLVLTSPTGAESFFRALRAAGRDARAVAGCRVATAGRGTAAVALRCGIAPDLVPAEAGSAGLLAELPARCDRLVVVQGQQAGPRLQEGLERRAESLERLALHTVAPHEELGRPLPQHDVIYFTSGSGVRAYLQVYGAQAFQAEVWCIGEPTLRAIREAGFDGKVVTPYGQEGQDAPSQALGRPETAGP